MGSPFTILTLFPTHPFHSLGDTGTVSVWLSSELIPAGCNLAWVVTTNFLIIGESVLTQYQYSEKSETSYCCLLRKKGNREKLPHIFTLYFAICNGLSWCPNTSKHQKMDERSNIAKLFLFFQLLAVCLAENEKHCCENILLDADQEVHNVKGNRLGFYRVFGHKDLRPIYRWLLYLSN